MKRRFPHFLSIFFLATFSYETQAQIQNNSVNIEVQPRQIIYDGVGDGASNNADINIQGRITYNSTTLSIFPCNQYNAGTSFPHTFNNTTAMYFSSVSGLPFNTNMSSIRFEGTENDDTHCVLYTDATAPSGNGDDDWILFTNNYPTNPPVLANWTRPASFWSEDYGSSNGNWIIDGSSPVWDFNIRTTWRYEHGNTCSDALNFGNMGANSTKTHNNSADFDPMVESLASGQVELVYTDNGGSKTTRDVWYKFTLTNTCDVDISTDNSFTNGHDTYLTLYSDCNTIIKTNDDGGTGLTSLISTKLCPGTYYIAVEGFSSDGDFGLSVSTGAALSSLTAQIQSTTDVSCNGGNNGAAVVTSTNYNSSYTVNTFGEDFNNLSAGIYNFECIDDNNCVAQNTVTITEPQAISYTPTTTDVSCNGAMDGAVSTGTVSGGTGAITIEITGGSLSALSGGTYSLIVTDQNQCADTQVVIINEPDPITFTSQTTDVSCFGLTDGSAQATGVVGGNGNYSYSIANESITALGAGSYDFIVEDVLGCTSSETIVISEPAELIVSGTTSPETIGNDGAIDASVNGGTAPYSFSWSNSYTTEDLTNVTSGQYTLTVTDMNGCTASQDFTVNSTVGLPETTFEASVFPNPTTGEIAIQLDGEFHYKLIDTAGKVIFSGIGNNMQSLDLAILQSGLYTLLLEVQEMMIVKKIVKK